MKTFRINDLKFRLCFNLIVYTRRVFTIMSTQKVLTCDFLNKVLVDFKKSVIDLCPKNENVASKEDLVIVNLAL